MVKVIALIYGKPGAYGISFPDYPGVASGGNTIKEAKERGAMGLTAHVEAQIEEGYSLGAPRELDDIMNDPPYAADLAEAVAVVEVEADLPSPSVKVTISMDMSLLARIDSAAKRDGETRSGYLARAAKQRMAG